MTIWKAKGAFRHFSTEGVIPQLHIGIGQPMAGPKVKRGKSLRSDDRGARFGISEQLGESAVHRCYWTT